jgi:SNF2 family DNA or RNA helicase
MGMAAAMDATLAARCRIGFSTLDRQKGEAYRKEGRVAIVPDFEDGVLGMVRGSAANPYLVQLRMGELPEGVLSVACTCPQYEATGRCKHIWATILEFDEEYGLPSEDWDDLTIKAMGHPSSNALKQFREATRTVDPPPDTSSNRTLSQADRPSGNVPAKPTPSWKHQLARIHHELVRGWNNEDELASLDLPKLNQQETRYWFVISEEYQARSTPLTVELCRSVQQPDGNWTTPLPYLLSESRHVDASDPRDRTILAMLKAANPEDDEDDDDDFYARNFRRALGDLDDDDDDTSDGRYVVPKTLVDEILPRMSSTGRLVWASRPTIGRENAQLRSLTWDNGPTYRMEMRIAHGGEPLSAAARETSRSESSQRTNGNSRHAILHVQPWLVRDTDELPAKQVVSPIEGGLVLLPDRLARVRPQDLGWIDQIRKVESLEVDESELHEFLEQLSSLASVPQLAFAPELDIVHEQGVPCGQLNIDQGLVHGKRITCYPTLRYGEIEMDTLARQNTLWDPKTRRLIQRDKEAERQLLGQLANLKLQTEYRFSRDISYWFPANHLSYIVRFLTDQGWRVVASGKQIRGGGELSARITTGIDWFDVDASLAFGDAHVALPRVLEALRNRQEMVQLDDGTHGLLPEEWLRRFAGFAEIGHLEKGAIRFHRSQALMLDALLAEQKLVEHDRDFGDICRKLKGFEGIRPAEPPKGFVGELRPYQRDGLAWLRFLEDFQLGGCLADDMGLGKTIQVLSLLEARRAIRSKKERPERTSLVVVPKSLVFNWIEETKRFAPQLRIADYTGPQRETLLLDLSEIDVLITTYGTLRRDIEPLRSITFDYAILDEATAIKNHASQTAKAARLLQARHRLAMTGTPVENHLGELWSLFEFLNPGMLGRHVGFQQMVSAAQDNPEMLELVRGALRPFIFRRTKEDVLKDLPEKNEQTLFCDMSPRQRKIYTDLRDHFRAQVTSKVNHIGLNRAKMHVLEALLRLRQAACDPRLIDENEACGAKVELLLERLEEVVERNHKALIFSQFTSLLAIVRQSIEQRGWKYEYLDGRTRDRQSRVERFQNDAACPLFLISLKAGGHGLNLTAADYVFILDPWWNPAVEAQAIDRAHRMGQTRRVMAYRIICRDTVEDKILQLQQSKREIADAIVTADKSLLGTLTADELQALLT